jgi:hypothetical protein
MALLELVCRVVDQSGATRYVRAKLGNHVGLEHMRKLISAGPWEEIQTKNQRGLGTPNLGVQPCHPRGLLLMAKLPGASSMALFGQVLGSSLLRAWHTSTEDVLAPPVYTFAFGSFSDPSDAECPHVLPHSAVIGPLRHTSRNGRYLVA